MDENYHERVCRCALNRLLGFEPILSQRILEALGSASALFAMNPSELSSCLGPFFRHACDFTPSCLEESAKELDRLGEMEVAFVTELDPEYPDLLRECEDRPVGLYVRGDLEFAKALKSHPPVAIVGTRDISPYGVEWTGRIVEALSRARIRPAIVSGMAMGCDIHAHAAALQAGLPTVAVLPTCADRVYPARHSDFADRLVSTPGCALISDYPSGTSPVAVNFIRRNRIIAGISRATVLIESKASGGGLITVRMASSYGRDVYALPGRVDDVRSAGCNAILQAKVAEVIGNLDVFVDSLGLGAGSRRCKEDLSGQLHRMYDRTLGKEEVERLVAVAQMIRSRRGVSIEELSGQMDIPYPEMSRLVGRLQADGVVVMDLLQRCSINVKIV